MSSRPGSMRATLPARLATLSYARDYVGIREQGANRGPLVELAQRAASIDPGQPWCAAFCNLAAELGCAITGRYSPLEDVKWEGYVQSYYVHGKRQGWLVSWEDVSPGDLILFWNEDEGRYAHIGFVDMPIRSKVKVRTVEGNSNDDGSREGIGVFQLTRPVTDGMRFLRWIE